MKKALCLLVFFLCGLRNLTGSDLEKKIDLEGKWRFEIGDNMAYSRRDFDDSGWEWIKVPSPWEKEGFPGYDGYAWYRLSFKIPADLKGRELYLMLAKIDGVDMTFFNGKLIGNCGTFPPKYRTAFNVKRQYQIPADLIRYGESNTIAVRVFDEHNEGGIFGGEVGIYSWKDPVRCDMDLSGAWKFHPGDDSGWKHPDYNDKAWKEIYVPDKWEHRGYPKLDGTAWYRRTVHIDPVLAGKKLVLLLGKINDIDEVFFNGTLIGGMGRFPEGKKEAVSEDLHKKRRVYFIPSELIRPGRPNLVAVRVHDVGGDGGIVEGTVGIVTREEYLRVFGSGE